MTGKWHTDEQSFEVFKDVQANIGIIVSRMVRKDDPNYGIANAKS